MSLFPAWPGAAGGDAPGRDELQPTASLFPGRKGKNRRVPACGREGKKREPKAETTTAANVLTFDQFQNVDLRVAEIIAAEKIKKSEKLLQLTVLVPEQRTIVAGIGEYYTPQQLVGKQVLVVANMKPATLMGIESQGMVLAARTMVDGKERLVLATVSDEIPAGSKVA